MVDLPTPDANDDAQAAANLRPVLDDELQRLPQRYRTPMVLFYLEGKSAEEVATALGRPRGTVLSQLARARERLHVRLSRRNLALSIGVFASLLEHTASADAAVPDRLLDLGMQTLPAGEAGVSAQARLLARQVLKEMLRRRLWTIGSLLFAALLVTRMGCLSYGALRAPPVEVVQAEASSDLDGLQGDWRVVAVEQGGRVLPKDQFPFTSLKIRADTIVHEGGPHDPLKGRFRLHPEQQPKAMDLDSEGYHGDVYDAIYRLEGDTLTICRTAEATRDATRPTELASSPGSNVLLYTAKRIQAGRPFEDRGAALTNPVSSYRGGFCSSGDEPFALRLLRRPSIDAAIASSDPGCSLHWPYGLGPSWRRRSDRNLDLDHPQGCGHAQVEAGRGQGDRCDGSQSRGFESRGRHLQGRQGSRSAYAVELPVGRSCCDMYQGKLMGDTIKGSATIVLPDLVVTGDWEAKRAKD